MDAGLPHEIRTFGQRFSNNPNEKFLLMILGSQAKLENDNRGVNVKRGLRTRVEMGLWPGVAPLGYLNQNNMDKKCKVIIDPLRGPMITQMFDKVAHENCSGRQLYHWLRYEKGFLTRGGKPLGLSSIYRILDSPFYYGMFEYPKDSGNWYQGKHTPLITKEVFNKAQDFLKRKNIVRENREFAFTKLMVCGKCGSGVSAQEKYKKLSTGTTAKYVYYGCGRAKDRFCKNQYLREEELIKQLLKILDKTDMNELGIQIKFEEELKRFNSFRKTILGEDESNIKDFDMKAYAKYILKEGSSEEKRQLLNCLKSRLVVTDRTLALV